jgi:DNA-directed RNA polymerase sigma subunit (sigma70/sigma32)
MCTALSFDLYCTNFKCPHNLFWEELNLDRDKIQMTDRALEIRNCCCLIIHPWTLEEISDAWGLTRERIRRSEEEAFKKLQRKVRINGKRSQSTTTIGREVIF